MAYEFNLAPKEFSEQGAEFKRRYQTLDDLPADDYIMMPKYDGCLAIVRASEDQLCGVETRAGLRVHSMPYVVAEAKRAMPGYVIFGEAYIHGEPFSKISGKFRSRDLFRGLCLMAFDAVPLSDWQRQRCDIPYAERLRRLHRALTETECPSIFPARVYPVRAPRAFADDLVKMGGHDGAILARKDAPWHTGPSKDGEFIKVKPVKSLDLKVVGIFPGKGKYAGKGNYAGMAGGITVEYRGVLTDVGTGFSDYERHQLWQGGLWGDIAEIEFMELTKDGKLRQPVFKGFRYDKMQAD